MTKNPPQDAMKTDQKVEIFEGLIRDPETNPTAKCTAIRTLMRIEDERPRRGEWDEELERLLRDDDN